MSRNKKLVPEAKAALDKFKMECASEVGVNLKNGYNGDLTAKENGSVGGQMVNDICPVRTMEFSRKCRTVKGYETRVIYDFRIVV